MTHTIHTLIRKPVQVKNDRCLVIILIKLLTAKRKVSFTLFSWLTQQLVLVTHQFKKTAKPIG